MSLKLLYNVITLFIWQGSVYLVPLITVPYLSRTLGVEKFGLLGIAGALVTYVTVIVDWGFSTSGTQKAAQISSDKLALRKLFWDVTFAKMLIGVTAVTISTAIVFIVPSLYDLRYIFLIFMFQVIFGILNASWLLQGLERMIGFAFASLIGRLLIIPLTLLFVKTPDDVAIAAAIQGGTFLISTAASLIVASKSTRLLPVELKLSGAVEQLILGARLFVVTGGITLYSQSNIVVLGSVSGAVEAGLYSGVDRIRRALQSLTSPLSTAVFPRVSNVLPRDPQQGVRLIKFVMIIQGSFTLLLSLLIFFGSRTIVDLFLGPDFRDSVVVLQIISPIIFVIGVSTVLGMNILLPFGLSSEFTKITVASGVFNIATLPISCYYFGALGAAGTILATEMFVTLAMALTITRRRNFLKSKIEEWESERCTVPLNTNRQ